MKKQIFKGLFMITVLSVGMLACKKDTLSSENNPIENKPNDIFFPIVSIDFEEAKKFYDVEHFKLTKNENNLNFRNFVSGIDWSNSEIYVGENLSFAVFPVIDKDNNQLQLNINKNNGVQPRNSTENNQNIKRLLISKNEKGILDAKFMILTPDAEYLKGLNTNFKSHFEKSKFHQYTGWSHFFNVDGTLYSLIRHEKGRIIRRLEAKSKVSSFTTCYEVCTNWYQVICSGGNCGTPQFLDRTCSIDCSQGGNPVPIADFGGGGSSSNNTDFYSYYYFGGSTEANLAGPIVDDKHCLDASSFNFTVKKEYQNGVKVTNDALVTAGLKDVRVGFKQSNLTTSANESKILVISLSRLYLQASNNTTDPPNGRVAFAFNEAREIIQGEIDANGNVSDLSARFYTAFLIEFLKIEQSISPHHSNSLAHVSLLGQGSAQSAMEDNGTQFTDYTVTRCK